MAPRPTTEPRPAGRPPFWRRQWIVDGPFQWSLVVRALAQTLATLLFVCLGIFGPIVGSMAGQAGSDDQATVMLYMHSRFWWIATACLLLAGFSTLLVSHRIAGPLVRFKRNLRWLAEGRLPAPLRTRDRDHLKLEVECLNDAVTGIARRIADLRTAHADVAAALQKCATELDAGDEASVRTTLTAALAAATRVAEGLGGFQAAPDVDVAKLATASVPSGLAPTPAN